MLTKKTKAILQKIYEVIIDCRHPCVEFVIDTYSIRENFTDYDITTKVGRENYQKQCTNTIGYLTTFHAHYNTKDDNDRFPFKDNVTIDAKRLDPWLSLHILLDDLHYQMETGDFVDDDQS